MAIDLSRKPKNALSPAPMRRWSLPARPPRMGSFEWSGLLSVLWRRKVVLLGLVAVAVGLTLAYLRSVTPQYEAQALVVLDSAGPQAVGIGGGAGPAPGAPTGLAGEVLLIKSPAMAERLVDRLNLHLLPEFNPGLAPGRPGLLDRLNVFQLLPMALVHRLPDAWVDALLGSASSDGREMTDLERAELLRQRIVEAAFRKIDAAPQEDTAAVAVRFRSADPELVTLAANALAEGYLEERRAQRAMAAERTAAFLSGEIEALQDRIREGETEIREYRRRLGLRETEATPSDSAELARLTSQLVLARSERETAERRLRQASRLLSPNADLSAAAEVLDNSPAIGKLRARQAELDQRRAELMERYGPDHPAVAELETEQDQLAGQVREEIDRITRALRGEVEAALGREATLQAQLSSLKGQLTAGTGGTPELRALHREVEKDRALLETYLTRAVELRSRQNSEQADARIVAHALIPDSPAYPPRNLLLGIAIGVALVAGTVVVVGLERMDDTFRSGEQIEEIVGLPTLGLLPAVPEAAKQGLTPETYVVEKPNSRFGEAVRSLRTALLLPRTGVPPRVVLFTSSVPGEGKTSMAVALARVNARAGRDTLIIDCDLRRPRLHESCGVANETGLSELLANGSRTLDQVVQAEEFSGMSFITAGPPVADPAALLASERMKTLLEIASRRFELVVLDSPPVLAVSDARVLAQLATKTVFLVRWGHTRRHDVMSGIRQLTEFGADMAGVVLTRVNARQHARYRYRDSGYYHDQRYTGYYTE